MRLAALIFLLTCALASAAMAQTTDLTLRGDPLPVVDVRINNEPLRLLVDPRMPDALTLNASAAARAGVRVAPMMQARLVVDDASLLARLARPNIRYANGRQRRSMAIVFRSDVVSGADGVIGPGALPYDRITITFGAAASPARTREFSLRSADEWYPRVTLAPDITARMDFNLTAEETMFNRPAVAELERARLMFSAGELASRPLIFGLATMMQPATLDPSVTLQGFVPAPAMARTNAPILSADDTDVVMVEGEGRAQELRVSLGRGALEGCWSIAVDRSRRMLTVTCAG